MIYLKFEPRRSDTKTAVMAVVSKSSNEQLGVISFYTPWRQYVFRPEGHTLWNPDCLEAVNAQVRLLNDLRKAGNKSVKPTEGDPDFDVWEEHK